LIPADARLLEGPAMIDYSFVTGESEPVEKRASDHLYAGGRQIGAAIEVEMVKPVSQSYLTSLWNQDVFCKEQRDSLNTLTNRYSRRFAKIVMAIAVSAALFWAFREPARSLKSFTSVLIVACPCALALAAPFALGSAQRSLGRRNVFLKNPSVLETLARVDAIVFDKTGTLTAAGAGSVAFEGAPLSENEEGWLYSMTRHSTHPNAVRIGEAIEREHGPLPVRSFLETPGCGMEGSVAGHEIWMGSAAWFGSRHLSVPDNSGEGFQPASTGILPANIEPGTGSPLGRLEACPTTGTVVHVAIDGEYRGCYNLASALRPEMDLLIRDLSTGYELALLSGDNEKERERFTGLFGPSAHLRFNQSPLEKLGFIRRLQELGKTVMMVGDGLNDAGALKQADVGVAMVEKIGAFSPASDAIMAAAMASRLPGVLRFSKTAVRVVRLSFLISTVYNIVGVSIAARGLLSPVVCAILMPLSSITVVGFACLLTNWLASRSGLGEAQQ
jgi:Cu+-exporting ATPase